MAIAEIIEKVNGLEDNEKHDVICGVVENLSVLSLSKLVKALEDKFGVKASGGGMMMMAAPAAAGEAEVQELNHNAEIRPQPARPRQRFGPVTP
jgi:ribosomal protein L7/L12